MTIHINDLDLIREALQTAYRDTPLGQAVARLQHPFVVRSGNKWLYEGFVSMTSAVRQALSEMDDSISPDLPPCLLDPATYARFFRIPLEDFNWQGLTIDDQLSLKLDRILANTEALIGQSTSSPSSAAPANGPLLTKKEVARRFQISTRTLDRWRSMGLDLGEITVGGTIRFDPAKIANIISTQKVKRRRK